MRVNSIRTNLQSYRATSPQVLPLGELDETTSYFILAHWLHYWKTRRHLQNRRMTRSRPRVLFTENFVKLRHVVYEIRIRAGRHTDTGTNYRHAHSNISHPYRGRRHHSNSHKQKVTTLKKLCKKLQVKNNSYSEYSDAAESYGGALVPRRVVLFTFLRIFLCFCEFLFCFCTFLFSFFSNCFFLFHFLQLTSENLV